MDAATQHEDANGGTIRCCLPLTFFRDVHLPLATTLLVLLFKMLKEEEEEEEGTNGSAHTYSAWSNTQTRGAVWQARASSLAFSLSFLLSLFLFSLPG